MRAARAWAVEPDVYFTDWSARSRGLAEALIAHEDGLCPGCGHPQDQAWDLRTAGEWDVHEHECQACQALADRRTKNDADPLPGTYFTVGRLLASGPEHIPAEAPAVRRLVVDGYPGEGAVELVDP